MFFRCKYIIAVHDLLDKECLIYKEERSIKVHPVGGLVHKDL